MLDNKSVLADFELLLEVEVAGFIELDLFAVEQHIEILVEGSHELYG